MAMEYRRLGRSGLKVSVLSFGCWVTFGPQLDTGLAGRLPRGGLGRRRATSSTTPRPTPAASPSESWARPSASTAGSATSYVVSSKFFWGIHDGANTKQHAEPQVPPGRHRRLTGAVRPRLPRPRLLPPRRPDTPIEETVWAMSDLIDRGWALYWGTSEWSADEIRAACEIAERHHLRKPVVEQPQYNLLKRRKVEKEYARLYEDIGLGTHHLEPAGVGPAHRQVHRRHPRGHPRRARRATSGSRTGLTDEAAQRQGEAS